MCRTGLHSSFRAHLEAYSQPCAPGSIKEDAPDTKASFPMQPLAWELLFSSVHCFPVPAAPWDRPDVTALVDGTRQSQALKPASSKDFNARAPVAGGRDGAPSESQVSELGEVKLMRESKLPRSPPSGVPLSCFFLPRPCSSELPQVPACSQRSGPGTGLLP